MADFGVSSQSGQQGTFFYRFALVTVDLASIGLPVWFFIDSVSFAYGAVIAVMQTFVFR